MTTPHTLQRLTNCELAQYAQTLLPFVLTQVVKRRQVPTLTAIAERLSEIDAVLAPRGGDLRLILEAEYGWRLTPSQRELAEILAAWVVRSTAATDTTYAAPYVASIRLHQCYVDVD